MKSLTKLYNSICSRMNHKISLVKTHLIMCIFIGSYPFLDLGTKKPRCGELRTKRAASVLFKLLAATVKFKMINPAFDNIRYKAAGCCSQAQTAIKKDVYFELNAQCEGIKRWNEITSAQRPAALEALSRLTKQTQELERGQSFPPALHINFVLFFFHGRWRSCKDTGSSSILGPGTHEGDTRVVQRSDGKTSCPDHKRTIYIHMRSCRNLIWLRWHKLVEGPTRPV